MFVYVFVSFFLPREKTDIPFGLLCIDFVFSTNQRSLLLTYLS